MHHDMIWTHRAIQASNGPAEDTDFGCFGICSKKLSLDFELTDRKTLSYPVCSARLMSF